MSPPTLQSRTRPPYCFPLRRDHPHIKPHIHRPPSTPNLSIGQPLLLTGYSTGGHAHSLHMKTSSSSRRTLQITPEKSNSISPPHLESQSVGTEPDVGEDGGAYDRSQDPSLARRGGRVTRTQSRRSTTESEPSPMPTDPQPFDFGELQRGQTHNQVYGYAGGTGKSRTSLLDALGSRNPSRRDVSGKGSRESPIRELVLVVAECVAGLDPNRDNDEGNYWSGSRRDNRGASRMSLFWSFHTQRLTQVEARL